MTPAKSRTRSTSRYARDEAADLHGTLVARLAADAGVRAGDRLRVAPNVENLSLFDPLTGEALHAHSSATE